MSTYLSFLFYSVSLSIAFGEINFVLIIGGWVFFILSIVNFRGYRHHVEFSRLTEITSLVNAALLMLISSMIVIFMFRIRIPDFLTVLSQLVFIISLLIIPSVFRITTKNIFPYKVKKENIFVIGLGQMGKSFINLNESIKTSRFNIVGIFDDNTIIGSKYKNFTVLGNVEDLNYEINNKEVKRIIVAVRHLSDKKIHYIESLAKQHGVLLNFLPSIESFQNNPGKLKSHTGVPLITKNPSLQPLFYKIVKRALDIFLVFTSFLLTLPFWIFIPLLIKKDSPGPVLFRQKRIGLNGKPFLLYKFRSMFVDSPPYAHCPTSATDPRITSVGRWLRRTSIDELPQIINILRGEMSMVGPRPEMPFIVNEYNTIEKNRLIVKPGLTGLWQVSPYRDSEISHNLEYDFYYIENQGFVLDFVILIMTIFFAIRGITH